MKRIAIIILFIILQFTVYAQRGRGSALIISGSIVDDQDNAIPFANAAVYDNLDSALIGGSVSDEDGVFSIQMKPGNYFLKITFLSYEEKIVPNVNLINKDIALGSIVLSSNPRLLEEVTIQGEKSQMELQLDKRVFNVGTDLSSSGGSAADILNNVPSVSVEVDGTVSLRGSENVRILINGKPSGLTIRDPDGLRLLQANLVERVEVITNPSSRYEAAGEVGIINIVLKKNQENGLNGTFTANAGHPDFLGGSYSLNLRRKKINLFSSYGMDYRKNPGFSKRYQSFDGGSTFSQQNSDRSRAELSHNFMGGMDYFINDKNTLTGSIMYNIGDGLNLSTLTYNDFTNDELTGTTIRTDREEEDEDNFEVALNYKKEFKREEQAFTADFQLIQSGEAEISDYTQSEAGSTVIQRGKNIANEKNWFFQTDYVHPFATDGKAEAGIRSATRSVINDYALEELQGEGNWVTFPAFNNNLIYEERIHAAYLMAGNKFNKFSVQAGLRGEYSDITTELTQTNEINDREYFNLFPSLNFGYEVNKNKTIQLSYSKRINRPRFRELLPFSNFSDSRNFFQGNPNLNPEYTHAFETGYLVNWENGSILSSAYYRYRQDVIQRITQIDEGGITRIFPANIGIENAYGLEFNISLTPYKWWEINSSANFYRAITDGRYQEELLYSDAYSLRTRATSKMSITKGFDFQASFDYRAPRITPQGRQLSSYSVDLALAKDILKGNGTITANVRDLFNTRMWRSIVEIEEENFYAESTSQWRPRQLMLTFTYRLNQMKNRERDQDKDNEGGNNGGLEDF